MKDARFPLSAGLSLSVALAVLAGYSAIAQAGQVSFKNDIYPILRKHCVECHLPNGQGHQASGFLVESYETVMKGTKYGPVVVPGDALSSSLYRLVAGEVDESIRMPHQKDPLPDRAIRLIELWIEQGAKDN